MRTTTKIGIATGLIAGLLGITAFAQGLGPSAGGSLAELTAEVRQLRMVIQDAGRNQTQMQALNISLTAQQSRLQQVVARLDGLSDQLFKASDKAQKLNQQMTDAQLKFATATGADRLELESFIRGLKSELGPAVEEENAIRTRQMEALNVFRQEEARWLELVAKLEAILKR